MPAQLLQSPCLGQACICKIHYSMDIADADIRAHDVQSKVHRCSAVCAHSLVT